MDPEKETKEEETQEVKPSIKSLRTYQGDVEEAVQKNHYSASSILAAEQNRRDQTSSELEMPDDSSARNKFFIILGSIMLLLGIITFVSIFYLKSKDEVVTQQKTKALISFSEEKLEPVLASTRERISSDILSEKKSFNLPVNSVLYINTVNASSTPAKIEDVLLLIAPQIPTALARSFDGEYMLGIYSFDTNEPFIILTTNDFANSFGGMLKWEKYMVSDLGKIFSIPQGTTLSNKGFIDKTLKNKDLRILQNENGKTMLLYSFIDKETLVITTNENILNALIGKYNISKQVR
ncbi:MAG: hypothetical protein WCW47_00995 [Candidatus Paceibacterota bacterium]|jgi:hypothetical protein